MKETLLFIGSWLGVMALIGCALLITKKLADFVSKKRAKTDKSDFPGSEFRNPYYISPEEANAIKEQTEKFNKNSD